MSTATATARRTKPTRLPSFDYIAGQLRQEYNRHAAQVDHYNEMTRLASTEKGKTKWRYLQHRAQDLKDKITAILYAYEDGKELSKLTQAIEDAIQERRERIAWLESHPQEGGDFIQEAEKEIAYFRSLNLELLNHVKDSDARTGRRREAGQILNGLRQRYCTK